MSLYIAISQQIAFVRNQVCPRTAYTTNGSHSDTLNIINSCNNSYDSNPHNEFANQLQSCITDTKEFHFINKLSLNDAPDQFANMSLIIANDDISMCVTIAKTYIQNSCPLVCILIHGTPCPIELLDDDELTVTCSPQIGEYYLISLRSKRKLIVQSIGENSQPPVCAQAQFKYLWSNSGFRTTGKQRILQRLSGKECNGSTKYYSKQKWDRFITNWIESGMDDAAIYSNIRRYTLGEQELHSTNTLPELPENNGRTSFMVKMLGKCIPRRRKTHVVNYLDYGCAEGAITAEMGKYLNLEKKQIFGADVRAIPDEGFRFIQLDPEHVESPPEPNSILPMMSDASISIITCSMVLHHVQHPLQTLQELRRVIRPDGCLIIREHHCDNPEMAAVLDIIHGLYSLSWSTPIEWPNFIDEYRARYLSQRELDCLAYRAGFMRITDKNERDIMNLHKVNSGMGPNGKITNIMQAYYATYVPIV